MGPGPPIQTTESGQGAQFCGRVVVFLSIFVGLVYRVCGLNVEITALSHACVTGNIVCCVLLRIGPPGCNLFVFHIPNDMTNQDLFNYFATFGNVISARIMVERETGRSRGFGTRWQRFYLTVDRSKG